MVGPASACCQPGPCSCGLLLTFRPHRREETHPSFAIRNRGGAVVVRGTCRERTQYTYWQPFIEFLDKVLASKSAVVTTSQLVDLYGK